MKGLEELQFVFDYIARLGLSTAELEFDPTLARGLNYYTGAIFEVKVRDFQMGSICGGGRYDDLTGIFGLPNVSGVGISFGYSGWPTIYHYKFLLWIYQRHGNFIPAGQYKKNYLLS